MRKALLGILMAATFATPAAAQEVGSDGLTDRYRRLGERNQQRHEQRQERREARQAERQSPVFEQRSSEQRAARQQRIERVERRQERVGGVEGLGVDRRVFEAQRAQRAAEAQAQARGEPHSHSPGDQHDSRRDRRDEFRQRIQDAREASRRSAEGLSPRYQRQAEINQRRYEERLHQERRQARRDGGHGDLHREYREEHRDLHASDPTRREHRRFHRQVNRDHNRYHRDWDRSWRNDGRYDWQNHRYSNRGLYSPGYYYSPYRGLGYSRFGIGVTLGSGFYSQPYWINDPWRYRLPEPLPGTRWIRYYNDVLLVDTFTGEVVDVIYDFFW